MTGIHRRALDTALPAVGRDVEAWCAKCGLALEHVIVAMVGQTVVQVRCRTCGGTHKYKSTRELAEAAPARASRAAAADSPGSSKRAPAAAKAPKVVAESPEVRAARTLWQRKMAAADRARATPYAASLQPLLGQLVDHATFGYGIVEQTMEGKAQFLFEQGYKVLIVGR